jgi:hypothetical protein
LFHVHLFVNEPELQKLIEKIVADDPGWRSEVMPLGLKRAILEDEAEAKHFDGFACMSGYKSEAETSILDRIKDAPDFKLLSGKHVNGLLHGESSPERIIGVRCAGGNAYFADKIVLAAGAMTSPRLLQDYFIHRNGGHRARAG